MVRGVMVQPLACVKDARRPVDAEAALAGPHPEPKDAAEVVEIRRSPPCHRRLQPAARDQLTLTDDLFRARDRLPCSDARAEPVEAPLLGAGERLFLRRARAIDAEVLADGVHGGLG